MRSIIGVVCAMALVAAPARASSITVENAEVRTDADGASVAVTVAWRNGWRNERNHDAAWVFVKVRRDNAARWRHARIGEEVAIVETIDGPPPTVELPADRAGVFLAPSETHRGEVRWRIELPVEAPGDPAEPFEASVHAIEMVLVPDGPFTLGDPSPEAAGHGAFYRVGEQAGTGSLFRITSEDAISVGESPGSLWHQQGEFGHYTGDREGPIPASFPKGFGAFYVMKYELSQGEYAAFLNHISDGASAYRALHGRRGYAEERGTLDLFDGRYTATSPRRPLNFVGWDDGLAFADWAGLRPMTELEYTKACRGPREPVAREYPWGAASKDRLARVVGPDGDLVTDGAADESLLRDDTRDVLGASHWWVMDLAGSVWERCVSVGHPAGRAFQGSHGDGELDFYGDATNSDWPKGDAEAGGYGYRGGGVYQRSREYEPGDFNPHSPVGWRPFGGWGGGPRSVAYGFRAVRTRPD